jgi:RNA polymerase sigma factor (sigma-70 family)
MKIMQNMSDSELIKQLYNGQERAFDVLFCRYNKDVRNVIHHYVKDRIISEDLCQDVFIRIYTSFREKKYNEQGSFLPWCLRISRNLCMDYLRKAAQFRFSDGIIDNNRFVTPLSQSAENCLVARQQEQELNSLINRLSDDQKKVIRYRFYEELSFREVATIMNTSVNTSLGRMRYGLMNLRKLAVNKSAVL